MKILFMGTGAADYDIEKRGECDMFRRNSTALVNDDLMIDASEHVGDFVNEFGTDLSKVKNILITHSHSDHYSPETIDALAEHGVCVWAEQGTAEYGLSEIKKAEVKILPLFEEVSVGRYTVMALPSNHTVGDRRQMPVCYVISDGEKRIFWGCDGSWLPTDTWNTIRKYKFDVMVFDGTFGDIGGDVRVFEHNDLPLLRGISMAIKGQKLLNDGGKMYISHMSLYSQLSHDELCAEMEKIDMNVAYDGL